MLEKLLTHFSALLNTRIQLEPIGLQLSHLPQQRDQLVSVEHLELAVRVAQLHQLAVRLQAYVRVLVVNVGQHRLRPVLEVLLLGPLELGEQVVYESVELFVTGRVVQEEGRVLSYLVNLFYYLNSELLTINFFYLRLKK
jgi:hypothetical protein